MCNVYPFLPEYTEQYATNEPRLNLLEYSPQNIIHYYRALGFIDYVIDYIL